MAGERLKTFSRDVRFADSVMDRRSWDAWEAEERPDPTIAAEAKVRKILAELDRILAAYEKDAREG